MPITIGVGHTIEGGVEVTENRLSYNLLSGPGRGAREGAGALASVLNRDERGRLTAAFLQDRWLIGSRLILVPGIRVTSFDRTGGRYTEPRLAATLFLTDALKLKTAAGRYYQFTNRITREDVLQGNHEFFARDTMRGVFSLTLFNLYDRRNVWYKEFEVIEDEIIENDIQLMGRTINATVTLKF